MLESCWKIFIRPQLIPIKTNNQTLQSNRLFLRHNLISHKHSHHLQNPQKLYKFSISMLSRRNSQISWHTLNVHLVIKHTHGKEIQNASSHSHIYYVYYSYFRRIPDIRVSLVGWFWFSGFHIINICINVRNSKAAFEMKK